MDTEVIPSTPSLHIPFAILAIAFAVLLGSQIASEHQGADLMKWQIDTAKKQLTNMDTLDTQYTDAIKNRETTVKQSAALQTQLQTLLSDLLDLARTDKDAEAIIQKWNVQRRDQGQGGAAAAPAAGAAPVASPAPAGAPALR